jgi:hypothetical protein
MKQSEFRDLIREEIKKTIKEYEHNVKNVRGQTVTDNYEVSKLGKINLKTGEISKGMFGKKNNVESYKNFIIELWDVGSPTGLIAVLVSHSLGLDIKSANNSGKYIWTAFDERNRGRIHSGTLLASGDVSDMSDMLAGLSPKFKGDKAYFEDCDLYIRHS